MSQDLKLSNQNVTDYTATPNSGGTEKKKSSGCGCFLFGCLGLLALIFVPIIGSFIYISSLSDAEWGGTVVNIVTNPDFAKEIKSSIRNNTDLSSSEKKAALDLYNKFLTDYENLPPQKQEVIKRNIFIVIKKMFTESDKFQKNPPKEFNEIIEVLGLGGSIDNFKSQLDQNNKPSTSTTKPSTSTTTPAKTTTTNAPTTNTTKPNTNSDPNGFDFDFDPSVNHSNTKTTAPSGTPNNKPSTTPSNQTNFDF